jgi:cell division protein FtsI/penicillin-binding protein 2
VLSKGKWKVSWSPATVDPALGSDGRFAVDYTWPQRAAVLASDGTPISPSTPTSVVVGLEGQYFKGTASLSRQLVAAGAPAAAVTSAIAAAAAAPTAFEPVFTVSWARYEQLRPTLYPIPGVFFRAEGGSGSLAPAPLAAVVGTLGAISTAELRQLGPPYTSESIVGQSGIEQLDERQLAGTPAATITVVDPTGATVRTLVTVAAKPGTPVRTTINLAVEQDAASALAAAPNLAALVAIDASTGRVLAAANTSSGEDLALEGEQPPGSTMKMITSTALIEKGLTPSSPTTCPPVIDVDGENLHNDEPNEGAPDLLAAFTVSCNTAFIGLTMANLDDTSLHAAAAQYGIGGTWNAGAPAFTGNVPVNDGQTDLAASAIGQSRVVMNPLDLAMVAADIDTGTVRLPWIAEGAPSEHAPTSSLPANVVSDLHEMMLSVVQRGTASGTGLPPGTYAKTGTAEYASGSGSQLLIDAWLAGFDGDVAFAMLVVDAPGDGGPIDGPIVAKFLDGLPAGL